MDVWSDTNSLSDYLPKAIKKKKKLQFLQRPLGDGFRKKAMSTTFLSNWFLFTPNWLSFFVEVFGAKLCKHAPILTLIDHQRLDSERKKCCI